MQLFELAKDQLKCFALLVRKIKDNNKNSRVLSGVALPFLKLDIEGKGEETPDETQGIDMEIAVGEDGEYNHQRVLAGIEDFVTSALFFAFNPLARGQQEEKGDTNSWIKSESDERKFMVFKTLNPETFDVRAAGEALDHLERLMFRDWKSTSTAEDVRFKTFASVPEKDRAAHLLVCLAEAAGLSEEDINNAFYASPDKRTLVAHEDFIKNMARVERTDETNFGIVKSGK